MPLVASSIISISLLAISIYSSSTASSAMSYQEPSYSSYYYSGSGNRSYNSHYKKYVHYYNYNNSYNKVNNSTISIITNSDNSNNVKVSTLKEQDDKSLDIEDFFSLKDSAKAVPTDDPLQDINKKILKFNFKVIERLLNKPKNNSNINKYKYNSSPNILKDSNIIIKNKNNKSKNSKRLNSKYNRQKYNSAQYYFYRKRNKKLATFLSKGINNFIDNLNGPSNTINFLLQKKPESSVQAFWRFAINSTFGLAGILDIASLFEMSNKHATYEQTFVKYGGRPGPYLMLPLLGASSVRGLFADGLEIMTNPFFFLIDNKLFVFIIYGYGELARNLDYYDLIFDNNNIDSYAKIRTLYLQNHSQAYSIDY